MKKQPRLTAHILIKGAKRSILAGGISAETIEDFMPPKENVAKAKRRLKRLGFEVSGDSFGINIKGTRYRFEKVFQFKWINNITPPGAPGVGFKTVIPQDLTDLIESIIFPEPTVRLFLEPRMVRYTDKPLSQHRSGS